MRKGSGFALEERNCQRKKIKGELSSRCRLIVDSESVSLLILKSGTVLVKTQAQ